MVPFPPVRAARGFTFVEVIVTVAVAAILLGVAAPSFRELVVGQRRDAVVRALAGDLRFARSESIKRASRIGLCARAAGAAEACGTNWSEGWLVWSDDGDAPGAIDAASGERTLRARDAIPAGLALANRARTVNGVQEPTEFRAIRFGPRGTSSWRGGGTFRLCVRDGGTGGGAGDGAGDGAAAAVNVSLSGDVRRAREDGSGAPIDAFGMPVTCARAEAADS